MALKINVEDKGAGVYVVSPAGRIDTDTNLVLKEEIEPLLGEMIKTLIFDMKALDYIDSTGLALILAVRKSLESKGGTLLAANLQSRVKNVFDVMNIVPKESVFDTVEEAERQKSA